MIRIEDKSKCCGCYACYNACPKDCISMKCDEEGFIYPIINEELCVNCEMCKSVCLFLENGNEICQLPLKTYAAKAVDSELRLKSSSGGIFTCLANTIIDNDGIVFGVAMSNDNESAKHIMVSDIEELNRLRGSKYLQSHVNGSYIAIRNALKDGKMVLFSGTPCQVVGLRKFLGRNYDNLICIDVICHGVPSSELWKKYLSYIKSNIINDKSNWKISFRSKREGWMEYGQSYEYNNKVKYIPKYEDFFLRLFLSDNCLRPSCYDCPIKKGKYMSDITLGDLWSINRVAPEMNDGIGTSLVIVRTQKGDSLFNSQRSIMEIKSINYESAIHGNSVDAQTIRPNGRDTFFIDLQNMDVFQLANKYSPLSRNDIIKILLRKLGMGKIVTKLFGGGIR